MSLVRRVGRGAALENEYLDTREAQLARQKKAYRATTCDQNVVQPSSLIRYSDVSYC